MSSTIASVYIDAPMVQGSYAIHHGGQTENFNLRSGTTLNNGSAILGGSITSGSFSLLNAQTWGGSSTEIETATPLGTGTRFAQALSAGVTITFSAAVKYVGFHWSAGNSGNQVTFNSAGVALATLTTTRVTEILGNAPNSTAFPSDASSVTSSSGSSYLKKYYFGNPVEHTSTTPTVKPSMGSAEEPFAYVHAFAQNDESFDSITFSGDGFELDNITISIQEVPIRNSLVLTQEATTSLTLGESYWNFKGVTTNNSSTISTGWVSDSLTATTGSQISLQQDVSISNNAAITMGRTALFEATLDDAIGMNCGAYSLVESYTATDGDWIDIEVNNSGTASRTRLIRGHCYAWTMLPTSDYGSGGTRPTAGTGTRFNANLDSPRLILPKLPDIKFPKVIPVDPRKTSLSLPQTKIAFGAGQIQLCIYENEGATLSGTWGARASTQNLAFSTGSGNANVFIASSSNAIPTLLRNLTINRINSSRYSVNRYALVKVAPYLGGGISTDCTGTGSGSATVFNSNLWPTSKDVFLIHLKPISLTQIRTYIVPLKNGRQQN